MHQSCEKFVQELIEQEPSLRGIRDETRDYWAPEEPPVTTLFAELAAGIGREFDVSDSERDSRLLALVERGMSDDDEALRTAVATGLIEALTLNAETRPELWQRLRAGMGPASVAHADEWIGRWTSS